MSYKIVESVVGGRVIEKCDHQDGINPAVSIPVDNVDGDGIYETGVTDFTGYATFVAGGESCMIPFYKESGVLVDGTKIGSADFSTTKDNGSTINDYEESGELKIQNKTAAAISLSVRF